MSEDRIFPKELTLDQLNERGANCMVEHLGIEVIEIGERSLTAKMAVDERTKQPLGLLHGGASLALAETVGSIASAVIANPNGQYSVGLEINANHLRAVKSGHVYATAVPFHIGRKTHVWNIEIKNDEGKLVCISRFTVAIVDKV